MNRDWFAMTQPETQGRVKALLEWLPLVFVDLHEMGSDSTYYFAPEAVPYNPHLAKDQRDALEWFGKNNAKYFDQYGFNYFTREVYDAFYPGYGASWPSYYGSVAMTYEQASARGLKMRRSDDTTFTYRDTVRQHFVASISTLETAAVNRAKLLENFYKYRASAIDEGRTEKIREYVLPRRGNVGQVDKLARLLANQGIEVMRAKTEIRDGAATYPAGSYVVSLAQPAKRFVRTLLDADVPMEPEFLKEQEARRRRKLPDEIYDVTAWSLPLLHGVECVAKESSTSGVEMALVKAGEKPAGAVEGGKATVAYLVPWENSSAIRFLAGALRADLRVHTADRGFTQGTRTVGRGALIVRVADNGPDVHDKVARLAAETGAEVLATNTGWVENGVNFGSRYVAVVRKPAIALAWDTPASSGSAGHTRYVLERQFGHPVSVIRTQQLANATDLSRYNVIVLPEQGAGSYATVLGPTGIQRLKDWVSAGGTLVGIGSATGFLADTRTGLLAVNAENVYRSEAAKKIELVNGRAPGKLLAKEEEFEAAIRADAEPPDAVAGVLVRAKTDPDHWLTAGAPSTVYALVSGQTIYTPIQLDKGVNAAYFLGPEQLLASGYLWEENRKQLAFKPLLLHQRQGRGQVIGFTADPNFRAYMDGLNVLFANAVLKGPGHAR
ncbi:MAG TPA: M14 family metallopeptidase [Bryobacteraceae bacterium]|nr:M14 family metallopeptidase [Bryobacteraceae bacterium]